MDKSHSRVSSHTSSNEYEREEPAELTADLMAEAFEPVVPTESLRRINTARSAHRTHSQRDTKKQGLYDEERLEPSDSKDANSESSFESYYEQDEDGVYIVGWKGPDDPEDPHNWENWRRWANTMMVAGVTFISPATSSIVAPAVPRIAADLNITEEVVQQIVISVFVLGYAIGPLFMSPLSEIIGRKWTLQGGNIFFLAFNISCGFAQTKEQLIAFRFLSGLGGSAPLSVGGGVLGDLWRSHERGRAMAIYSLCPVLGPSLGPLAGGFIAENSTWRWAFWATSIADGVILVASMILLQETFGLVLLKKKAKQLTVETGKPHRSIYVDPTLTTVQDIKINMIRPFKLLFSQVLIQFLSLYMSFLYGLLYIILTTFPRMWTSQYNESIQIGGLNYIAISIGYMLGAQVGGQTIDRIYIYLVKTRGGPEKKGRPEFRIPSMYVSSFILPIGLFWYGWSAQAHSFWLMCDIGVAILCFGLILSYTCIQTYIVDSYGRYAASAMAAVACVRSLCGFGFPLFAPYMFNSLGYGWGSSLLAFVGLALGVPAPFLLWKYGPILRAKSTYAASKDMGY